ncbi:hypothetical protein AALP_AA3G365500 [Arabis alpina]|uniref:Uncharacterized protein n=1 Tax=Arabis alpina TaxID=50452 RepID=A0A087HE24_ARAAL|nr:hypothetical protein AALP_AA3G365500 [Arabis alpina]
MNPISILFFFFCFLDHVSSQSPPPRFSPYATNDLFKPSLAIITGVFSIVFTLTFVLLVYAKCFHNDLRSETDGDGIDRLWQGLFSRSSRFSGLNKTAIESLPFFRFSALKGLKQGYSSTSMRLMNQETSDEEEEEGGGSSLEIYIEREEGISDGSSRFSSFRKILKIGGNNKKEKSLFLDEQGNEKVMHKFNHRINVVSDAVFKNRWSNVTSSDLTFLTSEMLNSVSSERFSSADRVRLGNLREKEVIEMKTMMKNKDSSRRAASEITTVPRENATGGNGLAASTSQNSAVGAAETTEEERRRRLWLPIARRTAQWFVNREKGNEVNNTTRQNLNV